MFFARSTSRRICCPADEPAIEKEIGMIFSSCTIQNEPLWRLRRSFTSRPHRSFMKSIMPMVISGVELSTLLRIPSTVMAAVTESGFTTKSKREARFRSAALSSVSVAWNVGRIGSVFAGFGRSFLFASLKESCAPDNDLVAPRFLKKARTLSPPITNFCFSGTAALRTFQYHKMGPTVMRICAGQLIQKVGMRSPAKSPLMRPAIKIPCHLKEGKPHL